MEQKIKGKDCIIGLEEDKDLNGEKQVYVTIKLKGENSPYFNAGNRICRITTDGRLTRIPNIIDWVPVDKDKQGRIKMDFKIHKLY